MTALSILFYNMVADNDRTLNQHYFTILWLIMTLLLILFYNMMADNGLILN